jgi:hypothetical protein
MTSLTSRPSYQLDKVGRENTRPPIDCPLPPARVISAFTFVTGWKSSNHVSVLSSISMIVMTCPVLKPRSPLWAAAKSNSAIARPFAHAGNGAASSGRTATLGAGNDEGGRVRRGVYRSSSDSGSDGASPNIFCWFCRTPESGLCRADGSEKGEDVRTPLAGEADQARWPYDGFGGVKPLDVEAVGGVDGLNESRPKKGLLDA